MQPLLVDDCRTYLQLFRRYLHVFIMVKHKAVYARWKHSVYVRMLGYITVGNVRSCLPPCYQSANLALLRILNQRRPCGIADVLGSPNSHRLNVVSVCAIAEDLYDIELYAARPCIERRNHQIKSAQSFIWRHRVFAVLSLEGASCQPYTAD
jgi:hypothetical protein